MRLSCRSLLLVAPAALALTSTACSDAKRDAFPAGAERDARRRLGIPDEARRVVFLGQTSHLDPGWLATTQEYFDEHVADIFTQALDAADADASFTAFYSEVAFLRMFYEQRPQERERLAQHTAAGALRVVGGGITSPDTLLPTGESLLRDFLAGNRWLRQTWGIGSRVAWLPDSFGHDPNLPSLLGALGYRAVGFSRLPGRTGMLDYSLHTQPAEPGSIAGLLEDEGAADFLWQAADGSTILAHWLAWGYFEGDDIDYDDPLDVAYTHIGPYRPDAEFTNAAIERYLLEMGPLSPTPYIYIPVGSDFQRPKPLLPRYAAAWNETEYATSGVWAVAAGFDEFTTLVGFHRDQLKRFRLNPNPYFTGFYGTRPALKQLNRAASYALLAAEALCVLAEQADLVCDQEAIAALWARLALGNHHDFITGTSVDHVYYDEQLPLLEAVRRDAEAARDARLSSVVAATTTEQAAPGGAVAVVFNPSGFTRRDLVRLPSTLDPLAGPQGPVPTQLDGSELVAVAGPVPPFGLLVLHEAEAAELPQATASLRVEGEPTDDVAAATR